jgi:hypothetical protein
MFISAVSTKGPDAVLQNDTQNICDLTPATFRVDFDEPIRVKNADFELVSCKITKRNVVTITAGQNTLSFRLGSFDVAEQYIAKIQPGVYTPLTLSTAIQTAIDEVIPCNYYRGSITCAPDGLNRILVTYTVPTTIPPPANFTAHAVQDVNSIEEGVKYNKTIDGNFVKYECTDAQKDKNTNPFRIPDTIWETCGGTDIGGKPFPLTSAVKADNLTRVAVDTFGLYESRRGTLEAVLTPVESIIESTFDKGFGGFTGGSGKPTYFTFEFERMVDDAGNAVTGLYEFGGMFNSNTFRHSLPVSYEVNPNKHFINGFCNVPVRKNDTRGTPYNITHRMVGPYSRNTINGNTTAKRELYYDCGWSGLVQFRAARGPVADPPSVPGTYAFQMNDILGGEEAKAVCIAKRRGFVHDRVKIRTTESPLIKGLPQTNAAGDLIDTDCDIVDPLNGAPATQDVKYKDGSIGQLNFSGFGNATLQTNLQGIRLPGPEKRLPYYKIISTNADGSPDRVVLVDSGERIIPFDGTDATNTSLFLNDPNTFDYTGTDDENTLMQTQIHRITPDAADIGSAELIRQRNRPRFASFNIGLTRDDIFQLCKQNLPPVPYGVQPNILQTPKNLEIDVYSVLETSAGAPRPATDQIAVSITQLQPTTSDDEDNVIINDQAYVRQIIFNATCGNFNAAQGSGPAITNWTTFVGAGNANGAIKIIIGNDDVYDDFISMQHNTNYPANPNNWVIAETANLTATLVTRGGGTGSGGPIAKNQCTRRLRFFPMHPVFSPLPCTIRAKNVVRISCIGTEYPLRNTTYSCDLGLPNLQNNYTANRAFMATGDFNAPQNVFPDPLPPGGRPLIMMKSQKVDVTDIVPGPGVPPDGFVYQEDFSPSDAGSMYNAGLHKAMYAQMGAAPATSVNFNVSLVPFIQPFMPSFSVEIQNLPCSGFIGKNYDDGVFANRKGLGSRLPIVGIVPAEQFQTLRNEPLINYYYKTPYPQPVQVRLPSETFLYSLDINLRNIITGQLLKDLVHNTEVVLRMYPLPDN